MADALKALGTVGATAKGSPKSADSKSSPHEEELEEGEVVESERGRAGGARGPESAEEPAGCDGQVLPEVSGTTCSPVGRESALVTP